MANLINEAKRFQKLAGLITESQLNEGIKTIDASKNRFEVEGDEDLKPTDLKPGVIISVIKSFRDKEELEDNAGKFEKMEDGYIYWKTKSGKQKSWPHIEDLALVKNLEMTESQLDELFGLGSKPKFKIGDAVYVGSSNQIPKIVSKVLSGGKYEISPFTKKNPDGTYEYDETNSVVASENNLNPYKGTNESLDIDSIVNEALAKVRK